MVKLFILSNREQKTLQKMYLVVYVAPTISEIQQSKNGQNSQNEQKCAESAKLVYIVTQKLDLIEKNGYDF